VANVLARWAFGRPSIVALALAPRAHQTTGWIVREGQAGGEQGI